jgi:heme/copper-type cytochrome/quinol oxidase subunit 2
MKMKPTRLGLRRAGLAIAGQLRRRAFTTTAAVIIGGSSSVLACPMCFGAEETSMVDGAKLGVLVMLAITLVVQGGFVGFFLYLRKRAKRIADIELDTEWSELQGASRTS